MIALGYAREENGSIRLTRLETGMPLEAHGHAGAILLCRLDFDVQILDIPRIPEKDLEGLIRYRLRSLYPGDPGETAFDYRVERDGPRQQAVVFISRRAAVQRYRMAANGVPLVLPYTLVRRLGSLQKNCRVWFCQGEWAELSVFRSGLLASSTVVPLGKTSSFDFDRAEMSVAQEARGFPVFVVARESDLSRMKRTAEKEQGEIRLVSFSECAAGRRRVDGIFAEHRRPVFMKPFARIAALALTVALLAMLVLFKRVWQVEADMASLKMIHARLEAQSRASFALEKNIDELAAELTRLEAAKPVDTYRFLSELSRVLGGSVEIRSLELLGNAFRIEAVGSMPLRLMESLRNDRWFDGLKLSQVIPDPGSGRERFSFSGVYNAR